MARILLVDDDQTILGFVRLVLETQGHQILLAQNGEEALTQFEAQAPDLILLDIMMPHKNGLDVCQEIRRSAPLLPIIFLTAKQQVQDLVLGFNSGADDYITKPFNRQELLARVQSALRRSEEIRRHTRSDYHVLNINQLSIDILSHEARYRNTALTLSRTEFRLLQIFCEYADRLLERDFLLQQVWGYRVAGQSRTVDNFVGRVRRKLEAARQPYAADYPKIESIYGAGYRLLSQPDRALQYEVNTQKKSDQLTSEQRSEEGK